MYEYRVVFYKIINGDQMDMVLDLGFYVRITQKVKLYGVSILPDKIDDSKDFLTKTLEGKDLMCQIAFSKKGKQGRSFGTLFAKEKGTDNYVNINELLIAQPFATTHLGVTDK